MDRHFFKKHIFTAIFLTILFIYSGLNMFKEIPEIKNALGKEAFTDIDTIVNRIENSIDENVYEKYRFIETYGITQKILGISQENGFSLVKDKSGRLHYAEGTIDTNIYNQNINDIIKIKEAADKSGAKTIVLITPCMYIEGETKCRAGLPVENLNSWSDDAVKNFEEKNVYCIDSRDYTQEIEELTGDTVFYKTDHHWRTKAAFYMFKNIVDLVREDYKDDWDRQKLYTDISNYNVFEYNDFFLGSLGRETGVSYSGLDDFELIFPKFETSFTRKSKATNESDYIKYTGSFSDAILNIYNMDSNIDIYSSDRYSTYLDSVNTEDSITNNINKEGPRVLAIRDSFMAPLGAYMSSACSQLDMVWFLRYSGNLEKLINEGNYDYVIVETTPSALVHDKMFETCITNYEKG